MRNRPGNPEDRQSHRSDHDRPSGAPAGGAFGEPTLLRRLNARRVLDALLELGPCTRTALRKRTGLSAPTMSKLMDHLMKTDLVEEEPEPLLTAGRPSKVFSLACHASRVAGVVIDIDEVKVFSCGLDGRIDEGCVSRFPTPRTYGALLSRVVREVEKLVAADAAPCLGVGVSVPGLLNAREERIMLSPNLRLLDGSFPARDIEKRLGLAAILIQEEEALCLAEQLFGAARGVDDFAMIDISAGLGMGVVSSGRFVGGRDGYGGELGHITVDPRGERCGCGNRGCLETLATDRVFARIIEKKAGYPVSVDEAIELVSSGKVRARREIVRMIGFLARGLGVVINLFNPASVFVYGRLFDAGEDLFDELTSAVRAHALSPSLAACRVVRSRGSKKQGAAAAVINHLFQTAGPSM